MFKKQVEAFELKSGEKIEFEYGMPGNVIQVVLNKVDVDEENEQVHVMFIIGKDINQTSFGYGDNITVVCDEEIKKKGIQSLAVKTNETPGVIAFNYEEIKETLSSNMETYKSLQVTDDNLQDRKKDKATLNQLKKDLDERRKAVKKTFMAPCTEFESKVKNLIQIIDEPVQLLDSQIKTFDEKKKEQKKEKIIALFNENVTGDNAKYIPFEKVFDPKWLGQAVSLKKIKESIKNTFDSVNLAIATIKETESDYIENGLKVYSQSLDLSAAIMEITRLNKIQQDALEREKKRSEAEEQRKLEEAKKQAALEERKRILEEQAAKEAEERAKEAAQKEKVKEAATNKIVEEIKKEQSVQQENMSTTEEPLPFETEEEPFEIEEFTPFETIDDVTIKVFANSDNQEEVFNFLKSKGIKWEVM